MHYALLKKSCSTSSGYIPIKATSRDLFTTPVYLNKAFGYRKVVQAKEIFYTVSRNGKHLSALFQTRPGDLYYGDDGKNALIFLLDRLSMEIFLFENQRHLSEALYLGFEKLPLDEVRRKARPLNIEKYVRQLDCYDLWEQIDGGQLPLIDLK